MTDQEREAKVQELVGLCHAVKPYALSTVEAARIKSLAAELSPPAPAAEPELEREQTDGR